MKLTLVDTGLGNLHSVERALRKVGADVVVASEARDADAIVVPGQGAFRDFSLALDHGLGDSIRAHIRSGKPYLGLCLGMQALFDSSDEAPGCKGLGVFPGRVRKLKPGNPADKVPHTGWNTVEGMGWFYFVHSYVCEPADRSIVSGWTTHGADRFASAVRKDNVFAVQFHPEKSQREGLMLLERWLVSSR